jgi:hypothetical protein
VGINPRDNEKDMQARAAAADQLRAQAYKIIDASNLPAAEIYEVAIQL